MTDDKKDEEAEDHGDDKIIVVTLPMRDYKVLRAMIDDRVSVYRAIRLLKQFLTILAGILVSWAAISAWFGTSLVELLKGKV
jgi:hypothetical protein